MKNQTIVCQNKGKSKYCMGEFEIAPDDFTFYEKMKVPPPTFCPECRRQQRFSWRNFINFYRRNCHITGKDILSIYSKESGVPVIESKTYHKDTWNPMDFGQEYDFSKPFLKQYSDLLKKVPKPAMDTDDGLMSVNCEYTSDFAMGKNCYLVIKAWKLEDVMYSFYVVNGRDLVDVHTSFGKDESNYETINTKQCYKCRNLIDGRGCVECLFSCDLRNCSNCFLSSGLRGKSYCYKNKQYTKEEYLEIVKSYNLQTYSGTQKAIDEFEIILQNHPRKPVRQVNCVDCTGDLIFNSKNCKNCFCLLDSENASYCTFADGTKDAMDSEACGGSELVYNSDLPAFCSNIICSYSVWNSQDCSYVNQVYRSKNCFGCAGLKDAQYCILNKQYTKEEYFSMVEKIKEDMIKNPYIDALGRRYCFGDFIPIELSYFSYNDSVAQELIYPLSDEEINSQQYVFQSNKYFDSIDGAVSSLLLPDDIHAISDSILDTVLISKDSKRQYKITESELLFYRKHEIPIPRESFYDRYMRRLKYTTSFRLYSSCSSKSGKSIITSCNPKDNFVVYTEDEYREEFE